MPELAGVGFTDVGQGSPGERGQAGNLLWGLKAN